MADWLRRGGPGRAPRRRHDLRGLLRPAATLHPPTRNINRGGAGRRGSSRSRTRSCRRSGTSTSSWTSSPGASRSPRCCGPRSPPEPAARPGDALTACRRAASVRAHGPRGRPPRDLRRPASPPWPTAFAALPRRRGRRRRGVRVPGRGPRGRLLGRPRQRRPDATVRPGHHRERGLHHQGHGRALRPHAGRARQARPRRAGRALLAGVRGGGQAGYPGALWLLVPLRGLPATAPAARPRPCSTGAP